MRNLFRGVTAALLGLTILASTASARRIAIPPLPDRIGKADAILTGKVTALEDKKVKLPGGGEGVLATIKVENALVGLKALTHVKVAVQPGQIQPSQEGCYFLQAVKGESHYTLGSRFFFSVISKEEQNFDEQLAVVKRCAALMADPAKGFKSKDADDRLLTAALLLAKYRPWGEGSEKFAPIDAAQSKQILEALADANWKKTDPKTRVNAQQLFFRLGLTLEDGWKQPQDFQKLEATAKEWLKANADTYRVKRFASASR